MSSSSQEIRKSYYQGQELASVLQNSKKVNPLKNPEFWLKIQTLCDLQKLILISDLDFALEKKIEVELWNVCFKDLITFLQSESKSKSILLDKQKQNEASMTLKWFLDFAIGFYVLLLQEIAMLYDLDLPFLRSAAFYGLQQSLDDDSENSPKSVKSKNLANVNYICAHCLVHLGDIYRYKGQFKQAGNFYRQSLKVAPASGHAYNQLALLEVSKGQNLNAIFFYIRALALKCPFPAASANLDKMYNKILTTEPQDYVGKFLLSQGLLHSATKLKKAVDLERVLCEEMTDLMTSEIISTRELLQCISILMFHLSQSSTDFSEKDSSDEEKLIYKLQVDLLAGLLSAFLMPVHIKQGQALMDFMALPLIKLILDWIIMNPSALQQSGFLTRPQIWPSLAKMLNDLKACPNAKVDQKNIQDFPLPEDFDLQAYFPLLERFKSLNFRQVIKGHSLDSTTITTLRSIRLQEQGCYLTSNDWSGRKILSINEEGLYEAIEEPLPPGLLEKLKSEFILKDEEEEKEEERAEEVQAEVPLHQPMTKKTKNVALAAILRGQQQQDHQKSVTFKTPSPNHSEDSQASQEDLNKPSYMSRTPQRPLQQAPMRTLPMDFSVPPPPIPRTLVPPPWPPVGQPRPVDPDPATLAATFGGPSYSLFAGTNPSWSLGSNERPRPPTRPPPPLPHQGQGFMFQSGPSPLERLLQQNPRFPPPNKPK